MYLNQMPGLRRRQLYGEHVRYTYLNRLRRIRGLPPILSRIDMEREHTYEELAELQDVKIGLIKTSLFVNSIVKQSEGVEFCCVCQDDIFLDIIRKLKCGHCFHINCIDRWFCLSKYCPTCKTKFE